MENLRDGGETGEWPDMSVDGGEVCNNAIASEKDTVNEIMDI